MSKPHPSLRSSITAAAITGVAAFATVFATAPAALADDVETPTSENPGSTEPAETDATGTKGESSESTSEVADETITPDAAETDPVATPPAAPVQRLAEDPQLQIAEHAEIVPNFGSQKIRVGVQRADGSYADGASTVGSTFTITTTTQGGVSTDTPCTTIVLGGTDGQSSCPGDDSSPLATYEINAGDTVTITQQSAAPGFAPSTETRIVEPCDLNVDSCDDQTVTFENAIAPAGDDDTITAAGEPVDIDVLANDETNGAPVTALNIDTGPAHGTAEVIGALPAAFAAPSARAAGAGTLAIRYTPGAGFNGTDTFTYALSTSVGTVLATVTIIVQAPVIDDVEPVADTPDAIVSDTKTGTAPSTTSTSDVLPETGAPDTSMLGYAALLLAGGSWLTARGRRRELARRV